MILNQQQQLDDHDVAPAETETPFDFFKRDYRLWLIALKKGWLLIAILTFVFGFVALVVGWLITKPQYESSCALVRQELKDLRQSGTPDGYTPQQMSVILNMIRSRANLQKTIQRLNLKITPGALFGMLEVKQAARNSNYIALKATANAPGLAADIANTQAEAFVEDYRRLIRDNLLEILSTSERNRLQMVEEIEQKEKKMREIGLEFNVVSVDAEFSKLSEQIIALESLIQQDNAKAHSIRSQITEITKTLSSLPPKVQVYEEKSTENQVALERARTELSRLEQQYTDLNPVVQKQRETVRQMEIEMKNNLQSTQARVVYGNNQVYLHLDTDRNRLRGELSGCESRLSEYRQSLEKLRTRRFEIDKLRPECKNLEDSIKQKKDLLNRLDQAIKVLKMFLERSYSDVVIYETATPPGSPRPTRRKLFGIGGALGGLILGFGIILLREALNLRVRSRVDIESALHLLSLGVIPKLTPNLRMIFYSSIQKLVNHSEALVAGVEHPIKLAITSIPPSAPDNQIFKELLKLLDIRDMKVITIVSVMEGESVNPHYLINDFLYGLADQLPEPDERGLLYFMLDDMAFISPPDAKRLEMLKQAMRKYDVIIWRMFEYQQNQELFIRLCDASDATIISMEFNVSDKREIVDIVRELKDHNVKNLCGILYGVDPEYYSLVI